MKCNMKTARGVLLSLLAIAGTLAGTSPVLAAPDAASNKGAEYIPLFELEGIVVTAPREAVDMNVNKSVITRKDIEIMHMQNVEEALRTVPGLQFLNYGLPGYNLNAVRINGSPDILVIVDGVRMSEGRYYPFHMLNVDNIEKIEILRGAAATKYGSGAKGGIISITTRTARKTGTKVDMSKGSFDTKIKNVYHSGAQKYLSYSVNYKKFDQGTTKDAEGVETVGSQDDEQKGLKFNYRVSDLAEFSVSYNENKNNFSLMDWIYQQDIVGDYSSQETILRYDQRIGDNIKNALVYRTGREEHYGKMRNFWETHIPHRGFWGSHFRNRSLIDTLEIELGDQHVITAGYEKSSHDLFGNVSTTRPDGTKVSKKAKAENSAWFLEEAWKPDEHWKLTAGVRCDIPKGGFIDVKKNYAKSYNLSYAIDKKTNFYVAHNDYFILPTVEELFGNSVGNDKLKAETGYNRELGFNHLFDENTTLSAHLFKRETKNKTGFDGAAGIYKNIDDHANGFDMEFERKFSKKWQAKMGYSYLNYTYKKGTTDYGYLPKNAVTVGVDYLTDKLEVGLDGRGFLGRGGNMVKEYGWPSSHYWVFNLGVNYRPVKNANLYLKINNLTNTLYAEHTHVIWADMGPGQGGQVGSADWYSMPGRHYLAGFEFTF